MCVGKPIGSSISNASSYGREVARGEPCRVFVICGRAVSLSRYEAPDWDSPRCCVTVNIAQYPSQGPI